MRGGDYDSAILDLSTDLIIQEVLEWGAQLIDYPNYFVDKRGYVVSVARGKAKLLKQRERSGYLAVTLSKDGVGRTFTVHRLVATAYIPNPTGLPQVNHIDEDKTNNSVWNLEWCTAQRNTEHSCSKSFVLCTPDGKDLVVINLKKFCRENGLDHATMYKVIKGLYKQHKGWRFKGYGRL